MSQVSKVAGSASTTHALGGDGGRRLAIGLLLLVVWYLVARSGLVGDYGGHLATAIAYNTIAVLSISVLAGAAGIWSLGHTAFIALGAYLCANLAKMQVPLELIAPVAAATAGVLGYALGLSAGRFSILYFGLLTLAVALTGMEIIGRLIDYTGGDQGMSVPAVSSFLLQRPLTNKDALAVALILAGLVFVVADVVIKGPRGRRWRAIKSQRIASMSMGLVPHQENALAFALSASFASVGGVAASIAIGYLEPDSFNLDAGVMLIVATVVGGIASFWGAAVGAAIVSGTPEVFRGLHDVSAFALGFVMVAVLLFMPRGLVPTLAGLWRQRGGKTLVKVELARPSDHDGEQVERRIAALAARLMPAARHGLNVSELSVSFGGLRALSQVSLQVLPGQTVGLIGPNGAGKTTLLNVLSGYVTPSSCAQLRIGEDDLLPVPPYRRLRHGFGRTFQHAELFNELTIREMLLVAASVGRGQAQGQRQVAGQDSPEQITQQILDALDLHAVADRFPDELPFGIQKAADIGRILAIGPRLVALDEPFSGLGLSEARELRAILQGMKAAGVSILIIDHAVQEVFNLADQVVVLDFGQVIATGTPQEIQHNADVQRAYIGKAAAAAKEERAHG